MSSPPGLWLRLIAAQGAAWVCEQLTSSRPGSSESASRTGPSTRSASEAPPRSPSRAMSSATRSRGRPPADCSASAVADNGRWTPVARSWLAAPHIRA